MRELVTFWRGGALALLMALTSGHARAADTAPPVAAPAAPEGVSVPFVQIAIVGSFPNAELVSARVASWFAGQGVATQTKLAPELSAPSVFAPSETLGVRLWILLSAPTTARLLFAVQERTEAPPRFLLQDVELRSGVDELGVERLAQVAYFSAVAAWQGSAESGRQEVELGLGVKAAAVPRPAPSAPKAVVPAKAKAKAPSKDGWHRRFQWSFDTSFHGSGGVFIGTEWDGGAAFRKGGNEIALMFAWRWAIVPYRLEKDGVTLDVSALRFGAVLSGARRLADDYWLCAELGPAFGGVTARAHSRSEPSIHEWQGARSFFRPTLFGGVGLWVDLGPVKYSLAATVDVPFFREHYDISGSASAVPEGHKELIVPWAAQPGVRMGLVW